MEDSVIEKKWKNVKERREDAGGCGCDDADAKAKMCCCQARIFLISLVVSSLIMFIFGLVMHFVEKKDEKEKESYLFVSIGSLIIAVIFIIIILVNSRIIYLFSASLMLSSLITTIYELVLAFFVDGAEFKTINTIQTQATVISEHTSSGVHMIFIVYMGIQLINSIMTIFATFTMALKFGNVGGGGGKNGGKKAPA